MGCQSRTRSLAGRLGVSIRGCLRKPWGSWATGAPFTDLGVDMAGTARHGRLQALHRRGCGGSRVSSNSIERSQRAGVTGVAPRASTLSSGDLAGARFVGELDERRALARLPNLDTVRGRRHVQEVAGP